MTDKKTGVKAKPEKIKLLNSHLFFLPKSDALRRIMDSLELDIETDDKIYKLFHLITDSPEARGFNELMQKYVKKHKSNVVAELMAIPDFMSMMNIDSGLEVERITVKRSQVNISTRDRIELEWLFEFV